MDLLKLFALFVATALAEIVGCYLPYLWLKHDRSAWLLLPAALSLAAFVWLLTLHPHAAGRVYAAYGGVYIGVALMWLWAVDAVRPTWTDWLGVAVWAVGLAFEAVGDAQLAAYKKDPDRGPVMDRGLWRYTRHPNYFGDSTVWWGIFLVCASAWPGVLTILSPVAMTYFLVFATGARLLERTMMKRPGYPEYAARTSMFLPLPPKKG